MFLINGEITGHLPAQDRGLHYGDGVFETIAVHQHRLLCWDKHYQRLTIGCTRLGIPVPAAALLHTEALQLINNHNQLSVLKIIITRGSGGRGYRPPADPVPARILGIYPWPEYPPEYQATGIKLRFCDTKMSINPVLAGIKHLNRLEQVLARAEWNDTQIAEGLMCDREGNIIAGTMSNLFIITGNTLITPDLSQCGIAGIIRACILELAPVTGLQVQISTITRSDLLAADEIFMCNSIAGIWPVTSIETSNFNVGAWTQKIKAVLIARAAITP